jgi:catechol 2,3-dioxygenase-like lactoylglutathione lyase family enzyme
VSILKEDDRSLSQGKILLKYKTIFIIFIMKIQFSSVFVDDQEKALKFYTQVLGFIKKIDVAAGNYRWLTVVSPDNPDGTELVLEPSDNPAAQAYKKAIYAQGIPLNQFTVADLPKEYERLKSLGVVFRVPPTKAGPTSRAMFEDTCGNLIQIVEA